MAILPSRRHDRRVFAIGFLWNNRRLALFSVHDQTRTEATVKLLKPVSLAFAAASVVAIAGMGPALAEPANWSPHQNVINSRHYTRMLQSSRAFRETRMRKECGPITDPQLYQQCIASFNRYSPT